MPCHDAAADDYLPHDYFAFFAAIIDDARHYATPLRYDAGFDHASRH